MSPLEMTAPACSSGFLHPYHPVLSSHCPSVHLPLVFVVYVYPRGGSSSQGTVNDPCRGCPDEHNDYVLPIEGVLQAIRQKDIVVFHLRLAPFSGETVAKPCCSV